MWRYSIFDPDYNSGARYFPSEYIVISSNRRVNQIKTLYHKAMELIAGEYITLNKMASSEYLLLVGSYKHFRFLLENFHLVKTSDDSSSSAVSKIPSPTIQAEAGVPKDWTHHHLTPKEFWCVMLGNLVNNREDREGLWDVIRAQVADGHAKKIVYLRLAIKYGNHKALVQLLEMGWSVNGPFWAYCMTPLRLSTRMEQEFQYQRPDYDMDRPKWGHMDTHKRVYEEFLKKQSEIFQGFKYLTQKNSETLKSQGGRMPKFVSWLRNGRFKLWSLILYLLLYVVVLPLVLAFGTGPYWVWQKPVSQKLAWMYLWSISAVLFPPILLFKSIHFFTSQHIIINVLLGMHMVLQHVIPLYLITAVKLSNPEVVGWLIPFSIAGPEAIAVLLVFAFYYAGYGIAAGCDGFCVLVAYSCGKGFKPGPLGIL